MKYLITIFALFLLANTASAVDNIKTIGTSSRDYTTITLWEADLDDGTTAANNNTAYSSGEDAIGEVYNDSVFDEELTIDGGGVVGLASIVLTVPSGQRHDGTEGNGARIVVNAAVATSIIITNSSIVNVEWLELDANGNQLGGNSGGGRRRGRRLRNLS